MATESAIFTALPNGLHENGTQVRVTVFVSPRLTTAGAGELPLDGGDFPSFADWPAALEALRFAVVFDGVDTVAADPDPQSTAPQSATWHLLFDDTVVRDGTFTDRSKLRFLSFPVKDVTASIFDLYTQVAESSAESFPPLTSGPLSDLGRQLGLLGRYKNEFYPRLDQLIAAEATHEGKKGRFLDRRMIGAGSREQLAFAEAYRFYDRPGTRDPLGKTKAPPPPDVPEIDFHGFVAFCGDYPKLLRPLGLALDVVVDLPPAAPPEGRIRLEIEPSEAMLTWVVAEEARPWTNYQLADRRFIARARDKEGDLVDGSLRLENIRRFLVNQIDVDGSALKTVDFAGNVRRMAEHIESQARTMNEDEASIPALRSAGFTIARDARAAQVVGHLDKAADLESDHVGGTPAELFAEDVTRGYRVDVEDKKRPNRWRTLHARTGTYSVHPDGAAVPLGIPPDEGFVKGASTTSPPEDDDHYLHEAMFGWEGWSLAAKRPGQAITNTSAEAIDADNKTDFPLYTSFEATPGTLPRLRFGRTYRFRARAVDLAGNSVLPRDLVPQHVTQPQTFRRFDPVPAPAVVPRRPFTEGESLMRMVIRSTLSILPHDYVALARVQALPEHVGPRLAYLEANERHLAPPLASQQLAEWHSKFDEAVGRQAPQADVDTQFDVASLESGSFLEPGSDTFVVNPHPSATPTNLADPTRTKGQPLQSGEYVCHDVDELELPYLPDPLSVGVSFTTLPGDAATRLQPWDAGADWYERAPFRIRIEDGTGAPTFAAGVLRVFLPQAEMVTVRLSSFMDAGDLELMGIWMLERPAVRAAQSALAKEGRHWMLTPWQPLTLVHAVEKPLTAPVIVIPPGGVQRQVGETFAVLAGTVDNHAKSTGRLDVDADWSEPLDDVRQPAPTTITGHAHAGDFQLVASEDACRTGRDDVPASGASPPVHELRHEFQDTKHRYVTYRATATTRFREYFPPEIANDPSLITHVGPDVTLDVPSSRRPDPPEVLYVVPTWTWQERTIPGLSVRGRARRLASTRLRTRTGGGLRVYLDRPWYSSGVDELLGVVLEDQPWFTWPFDVAVGLEASAIARAIADDAAGHLLAEGGITPGGRKSAPASERLLAGLQRIKDKGVTAERFGRRDPHAQLLASHAAAAAAAIPREALGAVPRFDDAQLEAFAGLIGIIFGPQGDPQRFVTHWGPDPIWGSSPPDKGPYIHQFPLRVAVGTGISLLEAPGNVVTVVGHKPEFDPERKLWYCDLQLDAGASYFPFVRLALARYQPHSIAGQHLSRVVFPDFTQLVAERTAAFTRLGRTGVAVSLRGPGAFTENARQLSPFLLEDQLDLSRFAVAQVERLPADATTDLAWAPVGDEIRLDLSVAGGLSDVRYFGTVPIPTHADGDQLRLSLREYEILQTDASEADDHIVRHLSFADFVSIDRPVRYRLVYADHFGL